MPEYAVEYFSSAFLAPSYPEKIHQPSDIASNDVPNTIGSVPPITANNVQYTLTQRESLSLFHL